LWCSLRVFYQLDRNTPEGRRKCGIKCGRSSVVAIQRLADDTTAEPFAARADSAPREISYLHGRISFSHFGFRLSDFGIGRGRRPNCSRPRRLGGT
jgi:hypothetical protein